MSVLNTAVQWVGAVGGLGVVSLMVRSGYRTVSKTHRRAIDADTDRDLVDVALKLLGPAEEQATRLANNLAAAEGRCERLHARIRELEDDVKLRVKENDQLRTEVNELKTQLIDVQLEAVRLRGMLSMD